MAVVEDGRSTKEEAGQQLLEESPASGMATTGHLAHALGIVPLPQDKSRTVRAAWAAKFPQKCFHANVVGSCQPRSGGVQCRLDHDSLVPPDEVRSFVASQGGVWKSTRSN